MERREENRGKGETGTGILNTTQPNSPESRKTAEARRTAQCASHRSLKLSVRMNNAEIPTRM